jgi:sugar O-acyltransferase (sialic acid O-acetyltransferase NeuD family)
MGKVYEPLYFSRFWRIILSSKVLIWGGKSQAHILHQMIIDQKLGVPKLVFDGTLSSAEFDTSAIFLNTYEELKSNLHLVDSFLVGIGGSHGYARHKIAKILEVSLTQISIISDFSFIDQSVVHGVGLQVMPGVVVHKFVNIGENVILNSSSTVDHDCKIGNGVHIMGSAAVAGNVTIEDFATIGTNATILPNIHIGKGAYIGAGAVVTKNAEQNGVYMGNPAQRTGFHESVFISDELGKLS